MGTLARSALARAPVLAAVLVVTAGLGLGLVRLLLPPLVSGYRAAAVAAIAERTGLEVAVDALGVGWIGWRPRIVVDNVRLSDRATGAPVVSFRRFSLDLDPMASLLDWAPVAHRAVLEGARLAVGLGEDGTLAISGLEELASGGPAPGPAFSFFLTEGRLVLRDAEVVFTDERLSAEAIRVFGVSAQLSNLGDNHQIHAQGQLDGAGRALIEVRANLSGAPGPDGDLGGELYLELRGEDLDLRARRPVGSALGLRAKEAHAEAWGRVESGRLDSVLLRHRLAHLALVPDDGEALELEELSALARWWHEDPGWSLDVAELSVKGGSRAWPPTALSLRTGRSTAGGETLAMGADFLDLGLLASLARVLPPASSQLAAALEGLRPSGELRDLRLLASDLGTERGAWSARADLVGAGVEPWRAWPGVRGANARVTADSTGGSAAVRSEDVDVRAPRLFRRDLSAALLEGEVGWRWLEDAGAVEIWSPSVRIENASVRTRSRVSVRLPLGEGTPFIDLQSDFADADASRTGDYLPVGIMSPKLVDWLDRAFVSGRVPRGTFLVRGPLAGFPYRDRGGRFEVSFDTENLILDYHADWPRLEGVEASVRFLNEGLEVSISQGAILESRVEAAEARIGDLARSPAVEITGVVTGPFADGLKILRETPLAARAGGYVQGLQGSGGSRVELDLAVPLRGESTTRAAGNVRWDGGASLDLADWGLVLEALDGTLSFTDTGLSARDLKARFVGEPITLELSTLEGPDQAGVRVKGRGRFGPETLARIRPGPAWKWLKGKAAWGLQLDIPRGAKAGAPLPWGFLLESDLRGMEVRLPAPLGKAPSARRRFSVSAELGAGSDLRTDLLYGDLWASLGWRRRSDGGLQLTGGDIGSGNAALPPQIAPGLRMSGVLDGLDLTSWLGWWSAEGSALDKGDPGPSLAVEALDVGIGRLRLARSQLADVRVRLESEGKDRSIRLTSSDVVGRIKLPESPGGSFVANLERLDLKPFLADGDRSLAAESRSTVTGDPRRVPPLEVVIAELKWGQQTIGRTDLRTLPAAEGMRFETVQIEGPLISLKGKGTWSEEKGVSRSSFRWEGHSDGVGELLRQLEFDSSLEGAAADVTLDLAWPDVPFSPDPGGLSGAVRFEVGPGRLLEVEPGFGRVLGIMNLGALRRRLSLDFSDLFAEGYAFEGIEGSLQVRDGVARTEDLVVEGISARVRIAGETDLASHEFDQRVTVTPDVSSSLAIAGAVAGGPIVGAAVLIANQVIGDRVDRLSEYEYRVTGPWENPVFERLGGGSASPPSAAGATEGPASNEGSSGTAKSPFLTH